MAIYLKNAIYIDWKTFDFKQTNIRVSEETKNELAFDVPSQPEDKTIDCKGLLVTKSFVCAHHHAYSALSRGMPAPKKSPSNFYQILDYIWWNLDKKLNHDMILASAYTTAIQAAKSGTTFIIDHHASPYYIKGSLNLIKQAFDEVGVSHLLCYEASVRDGLERAEEGMQENLDYLRDNQGLLGLHASFTVTKEMLLQASEIVKNEKTGIHIHVAEDIFDQQFTLREYKKRVIPRLADYGLLNSSKTILAHCIHLNEDERAILKNSDIYIVQNTESNLNNNVGNFTSQWLGNKIMLGTDGMHGDMLRSFKAAFFVGRTCDEINFQIAYNRLRMAHHYLEQNKFVGDSDNNLIILDYDSPTEINSSNFLGHLIFGIESKHIKHVISNGKLIIENAEIKTVNEKEILMFARKQAGILWDLL